MHIFCPGFDKGWPQDCFKPLGITDEHVTTLSSSAKRAYRTIWSRTIKYTNCTSMSDVHLFCMLQANLERRTWATLLIILYLAAHLAVSFLKLVQTLCILALVMLCVWDQVLVGLKACWEHEKSTLSNKPVCHVQPISYVVKVSTWWSVSKILHTLLVVYN